MGASMSRTTRWLRLNRGLPVILTVLIAVMATLFATTDTVLAEHGPVGTGVVLITESSGSTDVDEEGATSDTYTVVLSEAPSGFFEKVVILVLPPAGQLEVDASGG